MKKISSLFLAVSAFFVAGKISSQNLNITLASQLPYPTETLANICGYAAGGQEYALVGAANGMSIVDVTVPTAPVVITQIPNVNSLWKEIKVYGNYAYVTTEGGGGLQIVDLSNLPSPTLAYQSYTGDDTITGQLNTIHALHIDTTKKFIYLFGTNINNGGAVILDINTDPYNPTYVGYYENPSYNYVHDGYVDNDTLYAGHIYNGVFSVADLTNKSAPVVLATQQTPTAFTHNTWLSNDHKYVFTTDENSDSYLTAYDISNLTNITEVDKIRATPGSGSVVHNTHILNNWAVTSWYRDGITITDVTRPWNLVEVGRYDTYSGSGSGFDGAWGVYPFLPSGTLVVSNIDEGLFVLNPTYVRACYLEGNVTDSICGTTLNNVTVTISTVNVIDSTGISGNYATGTAIPGTYNVTFSKPGYTPKTYTGISFTAGNVVNLNVQLFSPSAVLMNGNISDASTTNGLSSVAVSVNGVNNYSFTTDGSGNFSSCSVIGGTYTVTTGAWGYETVCGTQIINSGSPNVNIALNKEYYDDFSLNLGWAVSSTSTSGFWTRGIPQGTTSMGTDANPGFDVSTDCNGMAYVTGNAGGSASQDDVDGGSTTLTSPVFDLSTYTEPWIHYDRWFFNGGSSGSPNDSLRVYLSNGTQTVAIETVTDATPNGSTWVHSAKKVSSYLTPTSTMQFIVYTADASPGHLVEAGLDKFFVADSLLSTVIENPFAQNSLNVFPNPFTQSVQIKWNLAKENSEQSYVELTDVSGRLIKRAEVKGKEGVLVFNEEISAGVYFANIIQGGHASKPLKIVKSK